MVQLVSGDVLLSKAEVIAVDIGPDETWSRGLAKSLRDKWPAIAKDFERHRARHPVLPGSVWTWNAPGGQRVAALVTREVAGKRGPGAAAVNYVDAALAGLQGLIRRRRPGSVAVARLCDGDDGLPWGDVEPFIHEHLQEFGIPVALYDRHRKGVRVAGA